MDFVPFCLLHLGGIIIAYDKRGHLSNNSCWRGWTYCLSQTQRVKIFFIIFLQLEMIVIDFLISGTFWIYFMLKTIVEDQKYMSLCYIWYMFCLWLLFDYLFLLAQMQNIKNLSPTFPYLISLSLPHLILCFCCCCSPACLFKS